MQRFSFMGRGTPSPDSTEEKKGESNYRHRCVHGFSLLWCICMQDERLSWCATRKLLQRQLQGDDIESSRMNACALNKTQHMLSELRLKVHACNIPRVCIRIIGKLFLRACSLLHHLNHDEWIPKLLGHYNFWIGSRLGMEREHAHNLIQAQK